jgi:hypothetical protein
MAADVSFLCRVPCRVVQASIGQPHRDKLARHANFRVNPLVNFNQLR